ncbi:MAG: chemotaxis-specific protein-glutamate methyltransferase CheB [Candidatus Lokiarchaeia archaeon]
MTIDVVIADDSAYLRKSITDILKEHDLINIVDTARDGKEAIEYVKKYSPDVLVLDLVMPKMNGLDAFKIIMEEHPTPTVILSAISPKNLDSSIQALLMGAFDYIIKPGGIGAKDLPRFREEVLAKVLLASQSQIKRIFRKEESLLKKGSSLRQEMVNRIFDFGQYLNRLTPIQEIEEDQEYDTFEIMKVKAILKEEIKPEVVNETSSEKVTKPTISTSETLKKKIEITSRKSIPQKATPKAQPKKIKPVQVPDLTPIRGATITSNIIVMGASVGGPRTITTILKEIPRGINAPILIVQHISSHFTDAFADNLDLECNLKIKVAKNGEYLKSGHVYIAPGDRHMEITVENKNPSIKIYKGTPVNFCMPSIDVLFFSAAKVYRNRAMGIILTGMGSDGVEGLGAIKRVGGKTIAEAEETCILFAMPKFAAEKRFAKLVLPNFTIAEKIVEFAK